MLTRNIKTADGKSYTVSLKDDRIGINYGGENGHTFYFDSDLAEPLIPVFKEFVFWEQTVKGKNSL